MAPNTFLQRYDFGMPNIKNFSVLIRMPTVDAGMPNLSTMLRSYACAMAPARIADAAVHHIIVCSVLPPVYIAGHREHDVAIIPPWLHIPLPQTIMQSHRGGDANFFFICAYTKVEI
jgi:hypothetical protein